MSRTSSKVKYRYNSKAYDYVQITVRHGMREKIKTHAAQNGESLNGYINRLISADMGIDTFGAPSGESEK